MQHNVLILFMNQEGSQAAKSASNSHLLRMLTKRSTKSMSHLQSGWPGKHAPSLANILIKRNDSKSVKLDYLSRAHHSQGQPNKTKSIFSKTSSNKFVKSVPMVKMGSTTLSLVPSARSKTIAMHSTWRSKADNPSHHHYQQNLNMADSNNLGQSQFKNSRVCQVIANQSLQDYKKRSLLEMLKNFEKENGPNKEKEVLNNFIIDYKAFNYIDKIIDNPEKWQKFVHKNPAAHNDFITALNSKAH